MLNHGCVMAEDIPRKMRGRAEEKKNRKRMTFVTYKMTKTAADEVSE